MVKEPHCYFQTCKHSINKPEGSFQAPRFVYWANNFYAYNTKSLLKAQDWETLLKLKLNSFLMSWSSVIKEYNLKNWK